MHMPHNLVGDNPVILQHVVIVRAHRNGNSFRYREELRELVVGNVVELFAVRFRDHELWLLALPRQGEERAYGVAPGKRLDVEEGEYFAAFEELGVLVGGRGDRDREGTLKDGSSPLMMRQKMQAEVIVGLVMVDGDG